MDDSPQAGWNIKASSALRELVEIVEDELFSGGLIRPPHRRSSS
jgi:hypothetical protein